MLARRLLIGGAFPAWSHGSLTPDGTPATVLADGSFNSQPGITWLDGTRALVVFNNSAGYIRGIIGTVTSTSPWTFSWGTSFTILATSTNAYDPVSVVDGYLVVTGNLYGSATTDPFIIISNDSPAAFTSTSTWGSSIIIPPGSDPTYDNITNGPVQKLANGTYLIAAQTADPAQGDGVFRSNSLTDWSAATVTMVGTNGAHTFTEIVVQQKVSGALVAHLRTESPKTRYSSTSTDFGATWTTPASAFSGYGFPMFSILDSGLLLATYRQTIVGEGETYWRQSGDDGATWTAETLLDGTDIGGQPSYAAYSTHLRLDPTHLLCVYSIGDQRGAAYPANLYSQVFTDSSTR